MKLTVRTLVLELLAALVLLVLVAAGALAWRLSKGPLELDFLKARLETALTDARGGLPVSVQGLALEWSGDKRRVEAVVRGVEVFGADGGVQSTAQRGAVALDTVALFRGGLQVARIRLENGETAVTRNKDGVWSLGRSDQTPDQTYDGPEWTITEWRDMLPILRDAIGKQSFERVDFSGFQIDIVDEVAGVSWVAQDAIGAWSADTKGVMIDVSADLKGEDAPESAQFTFYSDAPVAEFSFEFGIVGAAPERLASFLAARDLPFRYEGLSDANFGGEATEKDGLKSLQFSMAGENGVLQVEDERYPLNAISFEALMDMASQTLTLTQLSVDSEKVKGRYTATFDLADRLNATEDDPARSILPLTLTAEDAQVDLTPMFERPFFLDAVDLAGELDLGGKSLTIDRMIARSRELRATGSAKVWMEERPVPEDASDGGQSEGGEGAATASKFAAQVDLIGEGRVDPAQVLTFWPVKLGASARSWVAENVHEGVATRLEFAMDLRPETYERGYLDDDTLTLDFWVENADVSFLSDLPHVSQGKGVGHLRGNSISIEMSEGRFGDWVLDAGKVDIPRFHPKGAETIVTAQGRGDLRSVMQILEDSRLKTASELGIDLNVVEGYGGLDAEIRIDTNTSAPDDDEVFFKINGGFVDATVPDLAGGFGLVRSDVRIECTDEGLALSGSGRFGPAPVEFSWTEDFSDTGGTTLETTAIVTPDFLNAFNIAARNFMNGEAEVKLRATGSGRDFEEIVADVDFTQAALDLSEIGWIKQVNEPASGVIRYARNSAGEAVGFGDIKGDGLALAGEVYFEIDKGFNRAVIDRIYARDQMDLRGTLVRQRDNHYTVDVSGPLLNVAPWMDALFEIGAEANATGVADGAERPSVNATVAVDTLLLKKGGQLRNAQLVVETDTDGVQSALVAGTISPGKGLEGTLPTSSSNRPVKLSPPPDK